MFSKTQFITLLAVAGTIGYVAFDKYSTSKAYTETPATPVEVIDWVAAAPGRIEPKSGEIHLGTSLLGRVGEVLVGVEDKVEEGELLIRLDDSEARAKLASAETEAEALREDREKAFASGREDVRQGRGRHLLRRARRQQVPASSSTTRSRPSARDQARMHPSPKRAAG